MNMMIKKQVVLAMVLAAAGTVGFAQTGGDAIYKANCQSCHGSSGTPNPGMAKMMDIKAAADYKDSAADQIAAVKNGKGKMKPFAGKLTDDQIKAVVDYFRTLK
jgi:mono/diheme cytochrome c family protein